ncbi:MAG TPA: MBL fold metallo-hydrolase [Gammaproteobacteria bacterium]|nr:MBL fold metallo-hydrolase [Gammaproteobacteria bacterium]
MSVIRAAASILLIRGFENNPEIYLVKRSPRLSFMAGLWAFPGGVVNASVDDAGSSGQHGVLAACARRELFEETGVLLTDVACLPKTDRLHSIRLTMLSGPDDGMWSDLQAALDDPAGYLTPICELITPAMSPVRYQTTFLIAHLSDGCSPSVIEGELTEGAFFQPAEALRLWDAGQMQIAPPNLMLLKIMAEYGLNGFPGAARAAAERLAAGALHPIYFTPGIFLAALRTPTLPPATTTNTFIVGTQDLYLIDPATPDTDEQDKLFEAMDKLILKGGTFRGILLTHYHGDHTGAVTIASQRYRLPVRAHTLCYAHLPPGYLTGPPLMDGDFIDLGLSPDGSGSWGLTVIHTPGHSPDHMCFLDTRYRAAIIGDMVSTISTIVIDPPEGHMATYLNSLEKLSVLPLGTLYPAHGTPHLDGNHLIQHYLAHRRRRENLIIATLKNSDAPTAPETLLPAVYADVDPVMYPVAARSLLAGLIKLEEEGFCSRNAAGDWQLA